MVVLSPIAQQLGSSIEDRLQAIQKALRNADQQTYNITQVWLPNTQKLMWINQSINQSINRLLNTSS